MKKLQRSLVVSLGRLLEEKGRSPAFVEEVAASGAARKAIASELVRGVTRCVERFVTSKQSDAELVVPGSYSDDRFPGLVLRVTRNSTELACEIGKEKRP